MSDMGDKAQEKMRAVLAKLAKFKQTTAESVAELTVEATEALESGEQRELEITALKRKCTEQDTEIKRLRLEAVQSESQITAKDEQIEQQQEEISAKDAQLEQQQELLDSVLAHQAASKPEDKEEEREVEEREMEEDKREVAVEEREDEEHEEREEEDKASKKDAKGKGGKVLKATPSCSKDCSDAGPSQERKEKRMTDEERAALSAFLSVPEWKEVDQIAFEEADTLTTLLMGFSKEKLKNMFEGNWGIHKKDTWWIRGPPKEKMVEYLAGFVHSAIKLRK